MTSFFGQASLEDSPSCPLCSQREIDVDFAGCLPSHRRCHRTRQRPARLFREPARCRTVFPGGRPPGVPHSPRRTRQGPGLVLQQLRKAAHGPPALRAGAYRAEIGIRLHADLGLEMGAAVAIRASTHR